MYTEIMSVILYNISYDIVKIVPSAVECMLDGQRYKIICIFSPWRELSYWVYSDYKQTKQN